MEEAEDADGGGGELPGPEVHEREDEGHACGGLEAGARELRAADPGPFFSAPPLAVAPSRGEKGQGPRGRTSEGGVCEGEEELDSKEDEHGENHHPGEVRGAALAEDRMVGRRHWGQTQGAVGRVRGEMPRLRQSIA